MRNLDPGLIELFVDGKEDGLPDSGRLDGLGLGSGSVVFMLHRLGWRWDECGGEIALSEGHPGFERFPACDGQVAESPMTEGRHYWEVELTATQDSNGSQLVTGGSPMPEGRHYWEVELTWSGDDCYIFVGLDRAARPRPRHWP
jgi:hypothetical protein